MNRIELQQLSRIRRREAAALLHAKLYPGAYYLIGYAVECALKACIARQTRRHDFPDKELVKKVFVHDLETLLRLAALGPDLEKDMKANKALELNWAVVKDWKESSRYIGAVSYADARDLYSACTGRKNGILPCIRVRW
jgi:HEPN domain-containing protein